jgi:hypothetical protein
MKSKIEIIEDFGKFKTGDVLEFNLENNRYQLQKKVSDIGKNGKIVEYQELLVLKPSFVEGHIGTYIEFLDDSEDIDFRDLKIRELEAKLEALEKRTYNPFGRYFM